MTDLLTRTGITWYKPDVPATSRGHICYCRKPASGRTVYWDGHDLTERWQCEDHLPVQAAAFKAVAR